MSNRISTLLIAAILGVTTITLAACDSDDGPAEKAGKKIDKATDNAADAMDNAAENVKDKAQKATDDDN